MKKGAFTIDHRRAASTSQEASHAPARIRLPADAKAAGRAVAFALQFAETRGLGASVVDRLAIVVEEWVLNAVEHGAPAAGGWIGLRLDCATDHIRMSFTDPGVAFDPRQARFEGPNDDRGGGAGLALLHAWARVMRYERRGGRNRVTLALPFEG